jgi:hypothetical protein
VLDPVAGEYEDLVSARLPDLLVAAEDLDPDVSMYSLVMVT